MAPIDWALVVLTGIGGVFGLFCLFDGARRIALYGANSASSHLIGTGAVICLALAGYAYWKYSGQGEAHFVEFVMWLVWGAAALVFGTLFAREPAPVAEQDTKIEPVLAPPVAARVPQPVAAVASAKPAAPAAATPAGAPPPAAPKPPVGFNTMPLAKPVGGDTVPLPKPAVGADTVPLPKPGIPPITVPLARPSVGEDTVPIAKPAPGTFTPPKKP
jgi:hypothetical protein